MDLDAGVVLRDLAGTQNDLSTNLAGVDFVRHAERQIPILVFPTIRVLHVDEVPRRHNQHLLVGQVIDSSIVSDELQHTILVDVVIHALL